MLASGVTANDFVTMGSGESIVLKRSRRDFWDEGGYIEYEDTTCTTGLRSELKVINDWLQQGNLALQTWSAVAPDLSDRYLRRIFTRGEFYCGGRLFGGFWQPMKKEDRLNALTIDGERVVEVDYGQIMPRLLYAMCGVKPKMQDLYAIPGFETHRAGIKKVMCSMFFNFERLRQMPKGTREFFPRKVSIRDIVAAIEATHPAIKAAFGTGIGHRCQYKESQILTSVLLRLRDHGITALPIHDAVVIPASAADITQEVMLKVFRELTGADGVVEVVGR